MPKVKVSIFSFKSRLNNLILFIQNLMLQYTSPLKTLSLDKTCEFAEIKSFRKPKNHFTNLQEKATVDRVFPRRLFFFGWHPVCVQYTPRSSKSKQRIRRKTYKPAKITLRGLKHRQPQKKKYPRKNLIYSS